MQVCRVGRLGALQARRGHAARVVVRVQPTTDEAERVPVAGPGCEVAAPPFGERGEVSHHELVRELQACFPALHLRQHDRRRLLEHGAVRMRLDVGHGLRDFGGNSL